MAEIDMKTWSQIVAKAWADDNFKKRVLSNPAAVLREHGVQMPAGVDLRVVENTDTVTHLTLPPKPKTEVEELNDGELASVVGGLGVLGFPSGGTRLRNDFDFPPLFLQGTTKLA